MTDILPFKRRARRTSEAEGARAPVFAEGEVRIIILPVIRIERHKVLDCNEKTPPEGPSHRPKRKRA